ncbi:unnamed protein product [Diabrotica balteata]|uniref:ACB domain-containing protein n=1 Tax=Diabrotica balteata TaxID=107213 RepID=A0A9P0DVW9_DIABA|nr:unnamed protein product [Diabrotica balteata]
MTTEQKFNAAVNVIRSLPKNGSYQPSNELMLRFYAYFKQATNGTCAGSRPAFWDIVGRAKYDAWKSLGDMPKQEAMTKYVDELHSIVETMSYSDKVANFLEAPTNELDAINFDDLELIAGDVIERVRSQPNSPLASREGSPIRFGSKSPSAGSTPSVAPSTPDDSDHSDDEYIDTIEVFNPDPQRMNISHDVIPNGYIQTAQNQHTSRSKIKSTTNVDVSQEISLAVQSLRADIENISKKVNSLENANRLVAKRQKRLFPGVPNNFLVFVIAWPFIATFIMNRYLYRRNL